MRWVLERPFRLVTKSTVDENIYEIAKRKLVLDAAVLESGVHVDDDGHTLEKTMHGRDSRFSSHGTWDNDSFFFFFGGKISQETKVLLETCVTLAYRLELT
ncbi:unnamed protein product [Microthlaspi erraticum]|uniref:Uncharacterized protein n=1 Tax=Microthlaspi erraticum TaxID=1685480 RepID=A0A6D2JWR8_9BRAS|nr:unnamed protein product [Microthlaspi erraticum]